MIGNDSSAFLNSSKNSHQNTSKSSRSRLVITSNLGGTKNNREDNTYYRARTVTVVHGTMGHGGMNSEKRRKQIQVQISRTNLKNLDQFILDVSESLGLPKWKNDRIRQLFTLKGKRISQVADIFESDTPIFVALGRESLTISMVKSIVEDLQHGGTETSANGSRFENNDSSMNQYTVVLQQKQK